MAETVKGVLIGDSLPLHSTDTWKLGRVVPTIGRNSSMSSLYVDRPNIYIYIDRFYIALFSALGHTHCARM